MSDSTLSIETLVHEFREDGFHRIKKVVETASASRIESGEWTDPKEVSVVFPPGENFLFLAITEFHQDRYPRLNPNEVYRFERVCPNFQK